MAYHMVIPGDSSQNYALDIYLGSAATVNFYWESIGIKLNLPVISKLTRMADYEEDSSIESDALVEFLNEMKLFQKYWVKESENLELPEGFLKKIEDIIEGVEKGVQNGLKLVIA